MLNSTKQPARDQLAARLERSRGWIVKQALSGLGYSGNCGGIGAGTGTAGGSIGYLIRK